MTDTFKTALQKYETAVELYGAESDEAGKAFMLAMAVAPPEFFDMAGDVAEEMGLMPKASAYSPEGEPLFNVADIASTLGVTLQELTERADAINIELHDAGLPGILVAHDRAALPVH